jgi:hypothetical protein
MAQSGPTEMSAIGPLSNAKRTSASDWRTIAIYDGLAADIGLVNFDNTAKLGFRFDQRSADFETHGMCGLVRAETHDAHDLQRAGAPISDIGRPSLLLYIVILCSQWPPAETTSLNQG